MTDDKTTSLIAKSKTITIKVGSALLVDAKSGTLRKQWLNALAHDIAELKAKNIGVIVVSSGAIAMGRALLNLPSAKKLTLDQAQAAAAVGQIALNEAWRDALAQHDVTTGQILLTPNITEERRQFVNARATLSTLLHLGAVPIINENDSVATAEIRYGDNDRLSARVAAMASADLLILLSDVDGLYSAAPHKDKDATHLALIDAITPEIEAMAQGSSNPLSKGGMTTKIDAAKIATQSGTAMIIADGTTQYPITAIENGARHTLFTAAQTHQAAKKLWILGSLETEGTVRVDAGAAQALLQGKSLLPIGVTEINGSFERGATISIVDSGGHEIARGLSALPAHDALRTMGKNSQQISEILGANQRSELIHADNLVLVANEPHMA